jgi:hypothetical protein
MRIPLRKRCANPQQMRNLIRIMAVAVWSCLPAMVFAEEAKPLTPPLQTGFTVVPPGSDEPVASYPRDPSKRPPAPDPAIVGTVVPLATPTAKPPVDMQRFESKKGRFSLQYPADWFPVAHPAMAFQARPSLDSLFVIRVQVNKASKGTTSERYAKAQAKRFKKLWTIDAEEPATLSGLPAWRLRHVQIIDGRMTRGEKVFLVAGGLAYMLDCQTNPSSFAGFQAICAHAAASFAAK